MSFLTVDQQVASILGKEVTLCRDYASIIDWSVKQIQKWTSQWTDYSITDPGILFVNANAYMYDYINYALDDMYYNNVLRYTKSMESLHYMAQFVGLELEGRQASTAKVKISNPLKFDFVLPKDFTFVVEDSATGERIYFNLLNEETVRHETFIYAEAIEGEQFAINTTFGAFDKHFSFAIPRTDIGMNTLRVTAQVDGFPVELRRTKDAFLNTYNELAFSAHHLHNGVLIKFPPGARDFLTDSSVIQIIYGVSKGAGSNIGEATASPLDPVILGSLEVQSKLGFTILSASGGKDPADLEATRIYIGNNTWRVDTLFNNDDFNRLATEKFKDEIIRFVFLQEKGSEEAVLRYLPYEDFPEEEKESLVNRVSAEVKPLLFGATRLYVREMGYYYLTLQFNITLKTNSSDTSEIEEKIRKTMEDYFDRRTQEPEMTLHRSRLASILETNIPEISYASCVSPSSDIPLNPDEIFFLRNVSCKFTQRKGGPLANVVTI